METIKKPSNDHIGYLDSIRGIAALMVLFYHYIGWHYHTTPIKWSFLVINGGDAVSFFFVLSGFVLSYKYLILDHPLEIYKFWISRIFRLLPGFAVAVLAMAFWWNYPITGVKLQDLFIDNNQGLYEELFLFRSRTRFYGAGWTLVIELLISFFVPFIIVIAKRNKQVMLPLMFCILIIGNGFISRFFLHFTLGVTLAAFYYEITADTFRQSVWYRFRWILLPACWALFSLRHINELSPLGPSLMTFLNYVQIDFFIISGFASFVFLGAMIHSPKAQKALDKSLWRFYGRISYGIYLIHWFVVSVIFDRWDKFVSLFSDEWVAYFVMMAVCLAVSTLLATIIHYAVELPFMRWGKRLVRKMKPSAAVVE